MVVALKWHLPDCLHLNLHEMATQMYFNLQWTALYTNLIVQRCFETRVSTVQCLPLVFHLPRPRQTVNFIACVQCVVAVQPHHVVSVSHVTCSGGPTWPIWHCKLKSKEALEMLRWPRKRRPLIHASTQLAWKRMGVWR